MTETDSIFNEIAQEITSKTVSIELEEKERDKMDYLFWLVCSDISAGRLMRFLKMCPGCSFSQPFESFDLMERLHPSQRNANVKFIGIEFTHYPLRMLMSFYNAVSIMTSADYIEIKGAERFIIRVNEDREMIVQSGDLFTDFCRLLLNKTMCQIDEALNNIKEENGRYCSDKFFSEMMHYNPDAYDVTPETTELYIFLKNEYATKFNVFTNDFETIMNLGEREISGQFKIYRCLSQILSDGTIELAMILYNYFDDCERILFCRNYKSVEEFLNMTIFKADVRKVLQDKLDIVGYYSNAFNGVYVRD